MIDVEAVRADTPSCEQIIHFNNAGASLMPDPVFDAITSHLELERKIGGYEAARIAAGELESLYSEFAALLKVQPREIAYVENATRAWDMAFYGLNLGDGDRVLTHSSEYSSNYMALLQQSKRRGFKIDLVPSDESGQIDVAAIEGMITPDTRLIALTHVPTQGGLVNPAEAVGEIARKHNLLYLLDACQSVGQLDIDVTAIGCHMLSGTGRKFLRGPRGTGFLYVASDVMERIDPPFIDMHSATWTERDKYQFADGAKRYENWESYVAGRVGLARAVRYARDIGLDDIEPYVAKLAATLREALSHVPGIVVQDLGEKKCGIVSFQKQDEPAVDVAARLYEKRINVSVTDIESAQIDFGDRGIDATVRASVHYFNTENEVDRFVETLKT